MNHFKRFSAMLCCAVLMAGSSGCSGSSQAESGSGGNSGKTHEPLTIMNTADVDELKKLIAEKYPEISLEVIPYTGKNYSRYSCDQMITGEMPDIYTTTLAWTNYPEEMQKNLLDLSKYAFTDRYDPALLKLQEVEGGVYLLPSRYSVFSCAYNKTLFEKHGWEVPESYEELKALAPEIEKAGVRLAVTKADAAGQGFQYLCDYGYTFHLSAAEGIQWQSDFLAGNASAEEGFGEALDYMQEMMDFGLLQGSDALEGKSAFEVFREGNTAFAIGGVENWTQNEDGSGDQYAPMPYLSRDGSNNMYILTQSKNFGLSSRLAEKGNEQKLEDALHVMEIISTIEGQNSFFNYNNVFISSLADWEIDPESPYAPCMEDFRNGKTAPLLYVGWEGFLAQTGEKVLDFLNGKCTRDDVIQTTDQLCKDWLKTGPTVYAEVPETLDQAEAARLVAKIFGEAAGAECALISMNAAVDNCAIQNSEGINGSILPLPLTDERIVSFLPTGWNGNIATVTLKGAQIREAAEKGFTIEKDGKTAVFPYELVVKGGGELKEEQEYTVVVCGADNALSEAGNLQDSGIQGLQACKDFFHGQGNPILSEELLNWD